MEADSLAAAVLTGERVMFKEGRKRLREAI